VLVKIGAFDFKECPVRFLDPEDEQIVGLVRAGIDLPTTQDRLHLPARYVEGVAFVKGLVDGD